MRLGIISEAVVVEFLANNFLITIYNSIHPLASHYMLIEEVLDPHLPGEMSGLASFLFYDSRTSSKKLIHNLILVPKSRLGTAGITSILFSRLRMYEILIIRMSQKTFS